jgi:2-oxoglutarate dehydrogenase E2 component (dihydrolipoamide succinyltransferase)
MATDVKVPEVGESITEGTLARWLKKDGDAVKEGDAIFELETDKATGEVPAPASGRLKIKVKEGATVNIGTIVGAIEGDGAAVSPPREQLPPKSATEKPAPPKRDATSPAIEAAPPPKPAPPEKAMPPKALLEVERALPSKPPPREEPAQAESAVSTPRQAMPPLPRKDREVRKPMSRLRKTIADRLVAAQQTAAILTTFNDADMSQILAIRSQFKERFKVQHGVSLGFMSFFIKAAAEALKAFPIVNSRIDGTDIVEQNFYDIGVAVSTERGLMVPVIRDADRLHFGELEIAVEEFAAKARGAKITVEDLQGGTFTITNGGVFGSLLSTPILNPPQSAILGMHTIQKRPVAINDKVEIRPMMYLALSYDHRLIDGREAVHFLKRIKECVENPLQLLWGL